MHRFLLLLVGVAACKEAADAGPASFEPTLSARELWSGGELRITDAWFAHSDAIVELGGDTLVPTRVDDTTFALRLPRQSGTYPIRVIAGDQAQALGNVTLHGFHSVTDGPYMSGQPYWLQGAGAPLVFAGSDPGAAVVDLRTLTQVVTLPESLSSPYCLWTPSPTHRTNHFVLMGRLSDGSCGWAKVWQITPTLQPLDSIGCCSTNWYTSGQPSPGRWIFNWNNHNSFYICDSSCVNKFFNTSDGPNGVTISPRGDRFLWLPADRPVVYDGKTLDTAFVLPGRFGLQGAFSFEGDTLAVTAAEDTAFRRKHLALVRTSDGAILHDVRLDTLYGASDQLVTGPVAYDPAQPWLYAAMFVRAAGDTVFRSSIIVLERTSWTILGVLESPGPALYFYAPMAIVPSPLEHVIYVVSTVNGYNIRATRGVIFRYSTP